MSGAEGPGPDGGAGRLSVVGTPIGNLGDLTTRAVEVLGAVDAVICEDTRRTGRLLSHLGVRSDGRPALLVANEHTEVPRLAEIRARLAEGQHLALVTDAGMPTISDPGRHVVAAAVADGHRVEVVPGPSAVSAALSISGLAAERYVFEGFLPRKGVERRQRLEAIGAEERAIVVYESPQRVRATLADLAAACGGEREVAVARELTKLHEEVIRGTLTEVGLQLERTEPRGEFVVVIGARRAERGPVSDDDLVEQLRQALATGSTKRDAVADVAGRTGEPRRRVYELAIPL